VAGSRAVVRRRRWIKVTTIISLPPTSPGPNSTTYVNKPLASFDIAFVDPAAGVLLLADRSNKSIDVASTSTNVIIGELQPVYPSATPPTFAGSIPAASCPTTVPVRSPSCSGPNGVLSFHKRGNDEGDDEEGKGQRARTEVWAPDGFSRVWVLDLKTGTPIVPPISTAIVKGDPSRADELCYDPADGIVLVANPNSAPDFVTFISTHSYTVLGRIVMNGKLGLADPTGQNTHGGETPPIAAGGIEQCQYSPRTGKFYINVPQATIPGSPPTTKQDLVLQIDPVSMAILNTVNLTTPATGCIGTTGMALGPFHQIAIACGTSGTNSLVISEDFFADTTPHVHKLLGQLGTDETWYNPGDNHYFFPQNTPVAPPASPTLGVVDAFGDDPFSFVPQVDTPNPGGGGE
jgi:hypothetical protein